MKRLTPKGAFRADVGQRIATEKDAEGRVWCQLFPLGEWHRSDFPGGKLELTTQLMTEFVANWKAAGSPALPVDYHHEEQDEASGWIEDLRVTTAGLEGAIKWTEDAASLIKADKYRYLSPTWALSHVSRTSGEKGGPWLYGAALLNDPYFNSMPRVAASSADADETTQPNPNKEKQMTFAARIAVALALPMDTSEDAIVAAAEEMKKAKASAGEEAGKLTAALKSASDDTAKLTARVAELEKKHKDELFDRDFEAMFTAALAEGRQGLPAAKDDLKKEAQALGIEHTKRSIARLPLVPMSERGIGGNGNVAISADEAVQQFQAHVEEKMKAGAKLSDAYRQVAAEHPALATKANSNINAKA